jgi:hypothetical protein
MYEQKSDEQSHFYQGHVSAIVLHIEQTNKTNRTASEIDIVP